MHLDPQNCIMKFLNKTRLGTVVLVLVALLAFFGWHQRNASTPPVSTNARSQADHIEVAATDVLTLSEQDLALGMAVSGSLRAVQSAWVKSRVAGELQEFKLREGDAVKAGQVLGRIDPVEFERKYKQALEQAQAARSQVDIAQKQFENNQALVQQGFISKTALDTSLYTLQSAQATLRAAQAGADVAHKLLDDSVLRAPLSGLVATRSSQNGERLPIDSKIVEIVDLSQMEVEASLSPADASQIQVGQSALLQVEGFERALPARVTRINPSVQAGSRNVLAYLQLNAQPGLRQGLFAQGQIGTRQVHGLALPVTAVRTDQSVPYVQWIDGDKVAHARIQQGARGNRVSDPDGEAWVTLEGLPAGTRVLSGHLGRLREGLEVRQTEMKAN
jgi:RND family efflux transporter MFP subunit